MPEPRVTKIAIFGNGLAGALCTSKLVQILPKNVELTYIEAGATSETEALWGTVTPPATYDFLLGLDISEPDVFPHSNSSFSLGTHYKNWGPNRRNWLQSFYRPLPTYNGVGFHHYLTRLGHASDQTLDIQPYIMSVQAGLSGVFAHPPEGKKIPLADVEYGYHFEPKAWRKIALKKALSGDVTCIKADVSKTTRQDAKVQSVLLSNGQTIEADFYIDALGTPSNLGTPHPDVQSTGRRLKVNSALIQHDRLNGVCRTVTGTPSGWKSETPLQNGTHVLTIFDPAVETDAMTDRESPPLKEFDVELGRHSSPWIGNCLILGHGAARIEPLTPAPFLLLQRDIERLAELIPVSDNMDVESREYNRRFKADYDHADLFQSAFFETATDPTADQRLLDKIAQFKSRGVLVQYDYEPFTEQDWTILHLGMARYPERYDPLADHIPEDQLKNRLTQMRKAIEMMATKMPPHQVYMTGLLKYLKEKHG